MWMIEKAAAQAWLDGNGNRLQDVFGEPAQPAPKPDGFIRGEVLPSSRLTYAGTLLMGWVHKDDRADCTF